MRLQLEKRVVMRLMRSASVITADEVEGNPGGTKQRKVGEVRVGGPVVIRRLRIGHALRPGACLFK